MCYKDPFTAHILLVDDEPDIVDTYRELLEGFGYRVTTATRGDQALAKFNAHSDEYDLAITDYLMPGMNGGTLVDRLHERKPDLPVIMVSGYAPKNGIAKHRGSFLHKPLDLKKLTEKIEEALSTPV